MAGRHLIAMLSGVAGWAGALPAEPAAAVAVPAFDHPVGAASWGGIVRAAQGMDSARILALREGERVELLANTHIMRDDYPWFLIRFRGRQIGFMWGGILCRTERPVDGLYETCRR